jgi:hypothetical protein
MSIPEDIWDNRVYPQCNFLPYSLAEEQTEYPFQVGKPDPSFMLTPFRTDADNGLLNRNWPMKHLFGYDENDVGISSYGGGVMSITGATLSKTGGGTDFTSYLESGQWFYLDYDSGTFANRGYYLAKTVYDDDIEIDTVEVVFDNDVAEGVATGNWLITPVDFTKGIHAYLMLWAPMGWDWTIGWEDNAAGGDSGNFFAGEHGFRPGNYVLPLDMSKMSQLPTSFFIDVVPYKLTGYHGFDWPSGEPQETGDYQEDYFQVYQRSSVV